MPTTFRLLIFFALTASLGLAGCQRETEFAQSSVKRLNNMQRCLGAVAFPDGKKATFWCFELRGPELAVAEVKPTFEKFIRDLRFNGLNEPDWSGGGWRVKDDGKGKWRVTADGKETEPSSSTTLEIEVTQPKWPSSKNANEVEVKFSEERVAFERFNVLREKIGLKKLDQSWLKFFYEKSQAGDVEVFLCDIGPGPMSSGQRP